jgi:hypothetical protein
MDAATAVGDDAWRFQPVVQAYPHPSGNRCGVELAPIYANDSDAMARISLMIATALPGVDVIPGSQGDRVHLVVNLGKYYTETLQNLTHLVLNHKLGMVEPRPVVGLHRYKPLVWILGFKGLEVYGDHVRALESIDGIEGVTPLNGDHKGKAVSLYVPSLGVASEDDAAASAELLARIKAKFDFAFSAPQIPAAPALMPA